MYGYIWRRILQFATNRDILCIHHNSGYDAIAKKSFQTGVRRLKLDSRLTINAISQHGQAARAEEVSVIPNVNSRRTATDLDKSIIPFWGS